VTFQEAVKTCFQKYVTFSGKASRREYWFFSLFTVLCAVALAILSALLHAGFLVLLILGFFLPGLAVAARRLRDGGFSPLLLLLELIPYIGGIAVLVLMCMPSKGDGLLETSNDWASSKSSASFCSACGAALTPGQHFCAGCGRAL
jgi:uncharacterized membrane protein YhaH (DUF805 family)